MRTSEPLVSRMRGFGTTIFAEMSALAEGTGAVNLGQGFPDFDGPEPMLAAARHAISNGQNQYPPGPGLRDLRVAVAEHQARWYGISADPDTEVLVTAGATEGVTAAVLALCEAGDEIVVLDPLYDSYAAAAALAGAVLRPLPMRPDTDGRWRFDPDEARAAFGPRTRMLLLNSPHNPTGAVLRPEDLDLLAGLCVKHDVVAVTDEVYEHLVVEGRHVPLATREGMADRTVTISSAGKTFSCTGWKIGWAVGPASLVRAVTRVKQYLTYVNGAPFQPAVAVALRLPDSYVEDLASSMRRKRDLLVNGLEAMGLDVLRSEGTYFVIADIRGLGESDGAAFCRALPQRCGVAAVPMQVFCTDPDRGRRYVRFTYGKRDEVLREGVARLRASGRKDIITASG